jgi:hypothetical protein
MNHEPAKVLEDKLHTPIAQLAKYCNDATYLAEVISLAWNMGCAFGQRRMAEDTNKAFRKYTAELLRN